MMWLRNIASNYLRFIVGLGVMAVMTPIIIHTVGVEAYGQWAIVYAAIGLVSLSDLGFATAAIKFLAEAASQRKGELAQVTGALLAVYLLLTGFTAMIVAAVYLSGVMPLDDIFLLLGTSTIFIIGTSVHRAYLIALGYQESVNWIIIVASLAQALLTWYLLMQGLGLQGMALAHFFSFTLQALALILMAGLKDFPRPEFSAIRHYVTRIATFSVWALVANVCFMLILRVDPILIEQILTPADVALFAIALKVGEQALLFNKQFSNALLPLVSSRQAANQLEDRAALLVYSTRYLILVAAPFTGLLAMNAGELLGIWIGEAVTGAADSLAILALAALVSTSQFNAANINGMSGAPRFVALTMLASAVAKILLGLFLLLQFGIIGAAIGTLVAAIFIEATGNISKACRITQLPVRQFLVHAILPGMLCAIPAVLLAAFDPAIQSLWLLILLNGTYGLVSLALYCLLFLDHRDRHFFEQQLASREVCA